MRKHGTLVHSEQQQLQQGWTVTATFLYRKYVVKNTSRSAALLISVLCINVHTTTNLFYHCRLMNTETYQAILDIVQDSSIVCWACVISLANVLYASNSFGRKAHLQELRVGFCPNLRHLHLHIQMSTMLLNSNYSDWRSWHTASEAYTVKQRIVASCFLWGE